LENPPPQNELIDELLEDDEGLEKELDQLELLEKELADLVVLLIQLLDEKSGCHQPISSRRKDGNISESPLR